MNASRFVSPLLPSLRRAQSGLGRFLYAPASPAPLAALRIGLAAVLLLQSFALAADLMPLYGSRGVVQWTVMQRGIAPGVPRLAWVVDAFSRFGLGESAAVHTVFLAYVGSLACLLIGYRTRAAAVLAYLTQFMLKSSALASIYGVDSFTHIALFYCIWLPVGHAFSADQASGRVSGEPSSIARLGLRVFQFHLCIVYLASGLEKAVGADWWDGEAIWCALMRSDLCHWNMSWLAEYPWLAKLACWSTLVVEIGYPIFVWPRRTRRVWAVATLGLHVGIAIMLGLVSFAAVMIVFTASAFLVSPQPRVAVAVTPVEPEPSPLKAALAV